MPEGSGRGGTGGSAGGGGGRAIPSSCVLPQLTLAPSHKAVSEKVWLGRRNVGRNKPVKAVQAISLAGSHAGRGAAISTDVILVAVVSP